MAVKALAWLGIVALCIYGDFRCWRIQHPQAPGWSYVLKRK